MGKFCWKRREVIVCGIYKFGSDCGYNNKWNSEGIQSGQTPTVSTGFESSGQRIREFLSNQGTAILASWSSINSDLNLSWTSAPQEEITIRMRRYSGSSDFTQGIRSTKIRLCSAWSCLDMYAKQQRIMRNSIRYGISTALSSSMRNLSGCWQRRCARRGKWKITDSFLMSWRKAQVFWISQDCWQWARN